MDSVSRIHRRFSLTLINPSSHKTSLLISLACISAIAYTVGADLLLIPVALGIALLLFRIDYLLLKDHPVAKLSKVYHTNAFAFMLWFAVLILSILLAMLGNHDTLLIEGMVFAVALRLCIFTSVFGSSLKRSALIAPITPIALLLLLLPYDAIIQVLDAPTIATGMAVIGIAVVWCIMADRSGRPGVESTFRLLQAYLLAWTERDARLMESMMASKAEQSTVSTKILAFRREDGAHAVGRSSKSGSMYDMLILPDVHPGPFYPVGGSNLPYDIHARYTTTVAVMHGISDHSSNLPSRDDVERFIDSLAEYSIVEQGSTCTASVEVQVNNARVTGIAFGRVALLLLSSARGMDDLPKSIRDDVEHYAFEHGFKDLLIVDAHNCMGDDLSSEEINDMIDACKRTLKALTEMVQHRFRVGVARAWHESDDIGLAGMSAIAVLIDGVVDGNSNSNSSNSNSSNNSSSSNHNGLLILWADANNAVKGLSAYLEQSIRREVASNLYVMLCTSDTHYTSGKARNRMGYFPLGSVTNRDELRSMLVSLSKDALASATYAVYEARVSRTLVKIMGEEQFSNYSYALDRAMRITKVSITASILVFILMVLSTFLTF
ncbi:hypothetical protein HRbin04_01163 [archaeon HR04]|nr:hypothetical protein HRbin04_01163 [archaeon HR04]